MGPSSILIGGNSVSTVQYGVQSNTPQYVQSTIITPELRDSIAMMCSYRLSCIRILHPAAAAARFLFLITICPSPLFTLVSASFLFPPSLLRTQLSVLARPRLPYLGALPPSSLQTGPVFFSSPHLSLRLQNSVSCASLHSFSHSVISLSLPFPLPLPLFFSRPLFVDETSSSFLST